MQVKLRPYVTIACLPLLLIGGCEAATDSQATASHLIKDQAAFEDAVKNAGPGDVITLANGTWVDFEILFTGKGEKDKPITLTAETKGSHFDRSIQPSPWR